MSERDTHFKGFAELLLEDLKECGAIPTFLNAYYAEQARTLIAQRGYDLAYHVLDNIWEVHNSDVLLDKTPDLTQWPERS